MVQSQAKTVTEYLKELPLERRKNLARVREVVLEHLPKGYEEGILFGMICYYIPLEQFPHTYNQQPLCYAGLASQKNYISLYLMNVYGDQGTKKWFEQAWKKSGKKLHMGKSCIRFKTVEDIPLEVVGKAIARTPVEKFLASYKRSRRWKAGITVNRLL